MGDRLRAGIPSRYVTSQLGQLSLASLRGRLIAYTSFGWGKGGNVTSAGWQVTLHDPMWHVSSRSGVATLRTAIHLLLTYLLTIVSARGLAKGDEHSVYIPRGVCTPQFTFAVVRLEVGDVIAVERQLC